MGNGKKRRKRKKMRSYIIYLAGMMALGAGFVMVICLYRSYVIYENPEELLLEYMRSIEMRDYEKMYQMIDIEASGNIEKEDFIKRNSNIYEGIEIQNMQIDIVDIQNRDKSVTYTSRFDTVAGEVFFSNTAYFVSRRNGYKLIWDDKLIFPDLEATDKIRVSSTKAQRGKILDRNERVMAGQGIAISVGLVPMRIEDNTIGELSALLNISEDVINNKLSAAWVKDDSFVPIKTISKIEELEFMAVNVDEELLKEFQWQKKLLQIPGVMFQDIEVREYPYKEAASHLIGYVQNVTAEDLENHKGEGYSSNSVIGKSGMEGLYEEKLKGSDGYEIFILDRNNNKKESLAYRLAEDGQDIRLTIDAELQKSLYDQFKDDEGCSVAMNPYTGEVLALISTPAYDNNQFIMGMSEEQWENLNGDEKMPFYNRFRQTWCPGSTFKPIIAAIGLASGAINPAEDYGNVGLSWQKDSTWGEYFVTTLHAYAPVILENAMMYSDNIYFAKASLKIGAEELICSLKKLGFGTELPFEIVMANSQYSNTDKIDSEIQLADSGYGQGQLLINPLHLATLYTMFCNHGNIIMPQLLYQEEMETKIWISKAFSGQAIDEVLKGMNMVINNVNGTGYAAHRDDILLAGKTGTAEIKATQDDVKGTELGWFAVFTTNPEMESPILLVSMVEDVKQIGGSGYVVEKDVKVLDRYFRQ